MSKHGLLKHPAFSWSASIGLALVILMALGVLCAWGSIVESRYDAYYAHQKVYASVWMHLVLGLLCLNLIAVMIDRWPWRVRHAPFLLAHVGILVLLAGALMTRIWGVDGSIYVPLSESRQQIMLSEQEIVVGAMGQQGIVPLWRERVNFVSHNWPQVWERPLSPELSLQVHAYHHSTRGRSSLVPAESTLPKAAVAESLELGLSSDKIGTSKVSIVRPLSKKHAHKKIGLLNVFLGPFNPRKKAKGPCLWVWQKDPSKSTKGLLYIVARGGEVLSSGVFNKEILLPFMDLKARVLKHLDRARSEYKFEILPQHQEGATPALEVSLQGASAESETKRFLGFGNVLWFFEKNKAYFVSFRRKVAPLGGELLLKKFTRDFYPGTMRAAAYASQVQLKGAGEEKLEQKISMNQPLYWKGFRIYQSGFEEDDFGQVLGSVFSVNKDPGRGVKYLGSVLVVLGIVALFSRDRLNKWVRGRHA